MERTFADVLEIYNGRNQRQVENPAGKYPIYGSGGVMGFADDYICPKNTVVIGRKGNINKPIFVTTPFWNVDTAFGLVAKPGILLPKYLYYFCEWFDFEKLNTTVTIPSLTKANLLQIHIHLPSIEDRRKIVQKIEAVEALITHRQDELHTLDQLIKARFVEMFGDIRSNPLGYEKMKLGHTCKVVTGNTPSRSVSEYYGDYIEWIKTDNIVSGLLNPTKANESLSKEGMKVGKTVDSNSILTRDLTGGANGYSGIPFHTTAAVALFCAILAFVIAWNFIHSRYGQNLTAIRENEVAAAANGIDVTGFKKLAFVFSAIYAGWAGALYAHYLRHITPALFNLPKSCELVITTVLGGLGSLTGSVLGTLIVQLLPEFFRGLAEYRMLLYGIAVVVVILVRPSGLMGYREFHITRVIQWIRRKHPAASVGKGGRSVAELLTLEHVSKAFGGVRAIDDFNLSLNQGSIYGLIGPNGAGKTTIFNTITGIYRVDSGRITFDGREITRAEPHQAAQWGIARTFQNIRLFNNLSVIENVVIACNIHATYGLPHAILRLPGYRRAKKAMEEKAMGLLEIVGLRDKASERADSLPYGNQRKLEIARAMAIDPKLLLLDEPAAGMNEEESADLVRFIRELRNAFAVTILMIEHHMDVVSDLCEHCTVLNFGKTLATGIMDDIRADPEVIEAYLGGDDA